MGSQGSPLKEGDVGRGGSKGVARSGGRRPGAQVCRWREMGVGSVPGLERGFQAATEGKSSRSRGTARGRTLAPQVWGKENEAKLGRSAELESGRPATLQDLCSSPSAR